MEVDAGAASPPRQLAVVVEDDMPALNDPRRCARMALAIDEVRRSARKFHDGTNHDVRTRISDGEFFVCGGRCVRGREYSLYRQLVYAKRDADAYSKRGCYPYATSLKRAAGLYVFYDTDDETIDVTQNISFKDAHAMPRIAFVLKRYRRFLRDLDRRGVAVTSDEAADAFCAIDLDKTQFVACGGHKTTSAKARHSFYRQVVIACRDMRTIFKRSRFCKARASGGDVVNNVISSDEEEEDVDRLDLRADDPSFGECADDDWDEEEDEDDE